MPEKATSSAKKPAAKAAEKTEFIDNNARRKWDKEECALPNAHSSACSHFMQI
jgi:hypothetical protein